MGQHHGFLHLDSLWDGAFRPRFPFCQADTESGSAEKFWSLPEAKFCPYQTVSIPVSPLQAKNHTEQIFGPRESPHKMGVACCEQERSRDEVTDTNESLGISWNRQGQSQPWSLARHIGEAPSQLCVGREDSGECRSCQESTCPPCSGSALGPGQSLSLQRKAKL